MFVITVILALVLAGVAAGSAAGKLTQQARVIDIMHHVGVPDARIPVLAGLELLGALGLIVGLAVAVLGVMAAIGLALYFVGAVVFHLRAGDGPAEFGVPLAIAVLAIVVVILRAVTA